jgi:hypothetical protein
MPMMVTPSALSRFRSAVSRGETPSLARDDFVLEPGATDEMTTIYGGHYTPNIKPPALRWRRLDWTLRY